MSLTETLSARFQKADLICFPPKESLVLVLTNLAWRGYLILIGAFSSDCSFGNLSLGWLRLSGTSAELLLWVKQVAGIFYILKLYKNFIFKHSFQAMLGPIQQNWAANGQVQHWNKVRFWGGQVDLINSPVVAHWLHFHFQICRGWGDGGVEDLIGGTSGS